MARLSCPRTRTGRCRMAGGVQMAETRQTRDYSHVRNLCWFGTGRSGVYRVGESELDGANYLVAAATMDTAGDDWDGALFLLQFSMCESAVGAPIARVLSDHETVSDPAVRAAAEEIRDAQLELAMQAVAACDLSPDYFKVRKDNPWMVAASATGWTRGGEEDGWRSDREPWDLDHHFAVVSAWRSLRRARPVPAQSREFDHLARQIFFFGGDPTGRRRRAGGVLMFEAEPEAPSKTSDCILWRGAGADGRHYRVETRVNGVGDVSMEASVSKQTGRGRSDERLHAFVLSDSAHHHLLVPPGHVDGASLTATGVVFDAQLDAAFEAIAHQEEAEDRGGGGAGTIAA